jgi:hypothetical protein
VGCDSLGEGQPLRKVGGDPDLAYICVCAVG